MMVLSAVRKTTLGLTCKLGIGKNLVLFFVNPPKRKKGSVAKLRTTFCYIQHIAILILGKFNMEHAPKILRQNLFFKAGGYLPSSPVGGTGCFEFSAKKAVRKLGRNEERTDVAQRCARGQEASLFVGLPS